MKPKGENIKHLPKHSIIKALFNRRMSICLFNGFSAGLPLYYFYQFVPAWLRENEASLTSISAITGLSIFWSLKIFFAPFVDRYVLLSLGRRRSWMLLSQLGVLFSIAALSQLQPQQHIGLITGVMGFLVFCSSIQDIALDAYRRELLPDHELGLGNSFYANAYRVAGFVPGGLGLILADSLSWPATHLIIAAFMLTGLIKTLCIKEVTQNISPPRSLLNATYKPLLEFFQRDGLRSAFCVLAFIMFYKFGDVVATALQTVFFLDTGFTKTQIGAVVKSTSVLSILLGGFLGGLFIVKWGINKALWVFGFLQMLTILGFAGLSEMGPVVWILTVVVAAEYLAAGMGSSALLAFMARATNKNFTGTQMALLTSIMALPRTMGTMMAGPLVEGVKNKSQQSSFEQLLVFVFGPFEGLGYTGFFILCFVLAVPGMILLHWVAPFFVNKAPSVRREIKREIK